MSAFTDTLEIALELKIQGKAQTIHGGNVKRCRLALRPWGFEAEVDFWIASDRKQKDTLLAEFVKADLIEAKLTLQGTPPHGAQAVPLVLEGRVTDKTLSESTFAGVENNPVLTREYGIRFADAAAVLWTQHHPLELKAKAKLDDIISEHLAEGISLESALDATSTPRPMLCLGLGADGTSFYDFLVWFAESQGGAFFYDYEKKAYRLANEKPRPTQPRKVKSPQLEKWAVRLPAPIRADARILNAYSESPKTVPLTQDAAVKGISHDVLVRTPVAADVDARKTLEETRLRQKSPELEVDFAAFPSAIALWPGAAIAFEESYFSKELQGMGKTFRVGEVDLEAVAEGGADDVVLATERKYAMSLHMRWEQADDPVCRLPPHRRPTWPIRVEGKIVSEVGKDGDRTYMSLEDKSTSQTSYEVLVPLWNQKIQVPFQPHFLPGHIYAPAFRDSRVLLALHFDWAEILQFLDWGTDVRLPDDGQGNHILFGKNKTSQTSLQHIYVDSKPVLSLARTAGADHGLFQMKEGVVVLEVKDDPGAATEVETFDLTADVASAKDELSSSTDAAISQTTTAFQQGKAELNGKLDAATSKTTAALEGMSSQLSGEVSAATGELQGAMTEIGGQTAQLQAKAEEVKASLKSKSQL